MPTTGDISLYFHIPFCTKKCHYCHFFVLLDKISEHKRLIEAICLDIDLWAQALSGKRLVSIYFGGGTPSLLKPEEISAILSHVNKIIPFDPAKIEITLEANPETITKEKMRAFADCGINRVSIGVQTLDDALLEKLGRTHRAQTSINAVEATASAGFDNITIDLMYDIPCQTMESWQNTLQGVIKLPISHLSLYNLTIEPHTVFFKYQEKLRKELPDAECSADMYKMAQSVLEGSGLKQYEISAFARDGAVSRHNIGYWTGRPFLGFGPSAFSYWEGKRFRAVANLNRYEEALRSSRSPVDFSEELLPEQRRRELLAIALRLKSGVDLIDFQQQQGLLDPALMDTIHNLQKEGLLAITQNTISLTEKGILFYDTVAVEII